MSCGEISAFHVLQLKNSPHVEKFHMTDVEKSKILHIWHVCDVENIAIHAKLIAIYAVLLFTLFCREISFGEKLSPKVHLWRRNDKYEV